LQEGAEDYLALRRTLGFELKRPCRFIREFVTWLERNEQAIRRRAGGDGCYCCTVMSTFDGDCAPEMVATTG
jgi:hypothetical protein